MRVTVARSDPDARSSFVVERFDPMTVLDLLLAIQRREDGGCGAWIRQHHSGDIDHPAFAVAQGAIGADQFPHAVSA